MVCFAPITSCITLPCFVQAVTDKALGGAMMAAAAFVFVYYTTWALLLVRSSPLLNGISDLILFKPFFDASNPIHDLFLPREWAIRLPAFLLVVGLTGIGAFVGNTIVKENRKKAEKARLRAA